MQVGDRVTWKASGKGARCDGVAGTTVTGTITEVHLADGRFYDEDCASVKGDYTSIFSGHLVAVRHLRKIA